MQTFLPGPEFRLLHVADLDVLSTGHALTTSADLVLATSQVIRDELFLRYGVQALNVGHSLATEWFTGIEERINPRNSQPRIVAFAGNLSRTCNDWNGFAEIVTKHPELTFRFFGTMAPSPEETGFNVVRSCSNAEFLGLVPTQALVPALCEADILLFGFHSDRFAREMSNPHKVLEYLSTGNVVVGSQILEYHDRPTLFCMARMDEPLASVFDRALENYPCLNSAEARGLRIDAVRERSMEALLLRIEERIPDRG